MLGAFMSSVVVYGVYIGKDSSQAVSKGSRTRLQTYAIILEH